MAPHSPVPGLPMFIESRAPPKPLSRQYHHLLGSNSMDSTTPWTLGIGPSTGPKPLTRSNKEGRGSGSGSGSRSTSTSTNGNGNKIFTPHIPGRYIHVPSIYRDTPYPRLAAGLFTVLLLFFVGTSGVMYRYHVSHVHPAGRALQHDTNLPVGDMGFMGLDKGLSSMGYFERRELDTESFNDEQAQTDRFINTSNPEKENENGNDDVDVDDDDDDDDDGRGQVAVVGKFSTRSRTGSGYVYVERESSFGGGGGGGGFEYPDEPFDDDPQHGSGMFGDMNFNHMSSSSSSSSIPTPEFDMPTMMPNKNKNKRQTDPSQAPPAAITLSSSSSSLPSPSPSPSPTPTPTPSPNPNPSPVRSAAHSESTFRDAEDVRDPTAVKPDSEGMSMASKDADGEDPTSAAPVVAVASAPAPASPPAQAQPEARHWSSRKRGQRSHAEVQPQSQSGQRENQRGRRIHLGSKITTTTKDDE